VGQYTQKGGARALPIESLAGNNVQDQSVEHVMMDLTRDPSARTPVSRLASKWQRPEILEAIFDQLSDGLFIYDKGLHIVGVNQSAQRLFGMSAEEMMGKHCQELFHCTVCEPSCGMLQGLGSSALVPTGTVSLHLDNGRERMVVIRTVHLVDQAGALEGVIATVKDVTEETEPARRQIIAESQAMREVLNFVRRVAISEAASIRAVPGDQLRGHSGNIA
jgi:PAS domain S-box-containing protein